MIVYLHGFNSTGTDSGKFTDLVKGLPDIDIYAPTYPSNNPDEAIRIISELVETKCNDYDDLMFVGTSMGGYFAQFLGRKFNAKVVLINPALEPTKTLQQYLGDNTNFYTGEKYTLTTENIESFKHYNVDDYNHEFGTLVLIDKDDEIINYKVAYSKYHQIADCVLFSGGNHRFNHMSEAVVLIEQYYNAVWS